MTSLTHDTQTTPPHDAASPPAPGPHTHPQTPHPPADDPIDPLFTDDLLHALAIALPSPEQETEGQQHRRRAAAVVALRSFDAREPVEATLATHAVLAHHFTMECYRRAANSSQTPNLNTRLLGTAAMLSRTLGGTLHTLARRQDEPLWIGSPGDP